MFGPQINGLVSISNGLHHERIKRTHNGKSRISSWLFNFVNIFMKNNDDHPRFAIPLNLEGLPNVNEKTHR